MSRNNKLTVADIVDILENEEDIINASVYICPPENHMLSDGDSDEDDAEAGNFNHLSGNQLRAEGHLQIVRQGGGGLRHEFVGRKNQSDSDDSDDNVSLSELKIGNQAQVRKSKKKPLPYREWENKDLPTYERQTWTEPDFLNDSRSPVEWFELFYDDELVELIVLNSKKYAVYEGNDQFDVTREEMRLVIAIFLLSGYCSYARQRMFWDTGADTYHPGVANSMTRFRFEQILKYMHVSDNTLLDQGDKFTKVRPLWNKLNASWMRYFPRFTNVSIDESMVPYYGHHSTKQHIHGKPIRFGYKIWCMATRLGYLIQAEPYQGASTGNTNPELGVALKESGHQGTGTIRSNRVEKAPLESLQHKIQTEGIIRLLIRNQVLRWFAIIRLFKEGRERVTGEPCPGRPPDDQ
ncbi:piggyBac transposable element-derived protein 3-like [Bactrocera tryoni]|uniref:piggyBac transposable element-derived protein 3-like n=1 Tax=Bactrocera tryoni TaxID=59916 RepID=UPI001A96A0AF|nr:piggyBac transposable element-derived protein 3-like [Bactrocera tryoni]